MAFRYVVKNVEFSVYDKSKSEKYVAASFSNWRNQLRTDCATRLRRRVWLRAAL